MIQSREMFPLLFALNHNQMIHFSSSPVGFRELHIHSPYRILSRVVGLAFVPNSTTQPVRTNATSVLMGFDVDTLNGGRWNARILSSCKEESEIFLMDNTTLMPIAFAKLKSMQGTDYSQVSITATCFDLITILGVLATHCCRRISLWKAVDETRLLRRDVALHRKYARMVLKSENNTKRHGKPHTR
jgi:hypothetical protein